APAVIGDDDAVAAEVGGAYRVSGVQDAFHDELARPRIAEPLHVVPGDVRREQARHITHAARGGSVLRWRELDDVLEQRNAVRRPNLAAEQLDALMARARVDESVRDEADRVERRAIPLERRFVFGAPFDILECKVRRTATRHLAQLLDGDCATKITAEIKLT